MASRSPRWQRSLPRAQPAQPASAKVVTAGAVANTITLNFAGGADDIPTFSLADLRACVEKDDKDFFRRHFDGKVVLIGSLLDVEDRKITSKRFATAPEGARVERCALTTPAVEQTFSPQHDIRRVRPRDRGEQSAPRRRADRIRPRQHRHRLVRAGGARRRGRAGARAHRSRACIPWYCGNLECGRDDCVSGRTGACRWSSLSWRRSLRSAPRSAIALSSPIASWRRRWPRGARARLRWRAPQPFSGQCCRACSRDDAAEGQLDIFAHMIPAREVGGDLYDIVKLDENRVVITIGDVCGKGVPASLFMAITQTVMRLVVRSSENLEAEIAAANKLLVANNREADVHDPILRRARRALRHDDLLQLWSQSAAGPPPRRKHIRILAHLRSSARDCRWRQLRAAIDRAGARRHAVALHRRRDRSRKPSICPVRRWSVSSRQFSTSRGQPARNVVEHVIKRVAEFADGAPQSDDITCIAVIRKSVG